MAYTKPQQQKKEESEKLREKSYQVSWSSRSNCIVAH